MSEVRVVAEFGQSARGYLDVAIEQAQVAKDAGCYAVKYQTFQPDRLVSKDAPAYWDRRLGGADTQYQTFVDNGMLRPEHWWPLKQTCDEIGIVFMSSPFDLEAVDLLDSLEVEAFKIASGEITHRAMLKKIAATKRDVILSTGGATAGEIHRALDWLDGCNVVLLACDLAYPCPAESANLARIEGLGGFTKAKAVGYSDHTVHVETAFGAAVLGATYLEKHCRLDDSDGVCPDDQMALLPAELREYCRLAQLGAAMRGDPYPGMSVAERPAVEGARRSLHASKFLRKGHVLRDGDLVALRPGDGIPAAHDESLWGKKVTRTLRVGEKLVPGDVA